MMKALILTALTLSLSACGVNESALRIDQSANIAAQEMSSTSKKGKPQKSKKGEKAPMQEKPTSDQTSANTDTNTDEEELVCCKTDMGNMLVPAQECDKSQIQPAELCEEEICCKDPFGDGPALATLTECTDNDSEPTSMDACEPQEELVCCMTSSGAQMVPESECDDDYEITEDHCEEVEVCCKIDDGFAIMSQSECEELGTPAEPERCEEEEICCKDPYGDGPELATLTECIDNGSEQTSMDACEPQDELVCCHTLFGMVILPASECEDIVADEYCDGEEEDTCCRIDNNFVTLPLSECEEQGGFPNAPADLCEEPTEEALFHCCYLNDGAPVSSAAAMSPELCEEYYQGVVIPNNSDGLPQHDDATLRACDSLKSDNDHRARSPEKTKDTNKNSRSIAQ